MYAGHVPHITRSGMQTGDAGAEKSRGKKRPALALGPDHEDSEAEGGKADDSDDSDDSDDDGQVPRLGVTKKQSKAAKITDLAAKLNKWKQQIGNLEFDDLMSAYKSSWTVMSKKQEAVVKDLSRVSKEFKDHRRVKLPKSLEEYQLRVRDSLSTKVLNFMDARRRFQLEENSLGMVVDRACRVVLGADHPGLPPPHLVRNVHAEQYRKSLMVRMLSQVEAPEGLAAACAADPDTRIKELEEVSRKLKEENRKLKEENKMLEEKKNVLKKTLKAQTQRKQLQLRLGFLGVDTYSRVGSGPGAGVGSGAGSDVDLERRTKASV